MIARRFASRSTFKKTHKRLCRLLHAACKKYPARISFFEYHWEWQPHEMTQGVAIRYGNTDAGINVEAVFPDSNPVMMELFGSLVCAPGVFEVRDIADELVPIKLPRVQWSSSSGLLPVESIKPRWENMHEQEKAYAVCLFDCVRLEHLLRKYLPVDQQTPGQQESSDDDVHAEADDEAIRGEVEAPERVSSRVAMGQAAWMFACLPGHGDLLMGMGCYYDLTKLVAFRNFLIHGVHSYAYTSNKLRKSYDLLQHILYHIKRWPQALKLHRAIARLIGDWHAQSGVLGPPHPPSTLMVAYRKGNIDKRRLGLGEEDFAALKESLGMLVSSAKAYTPEEMEIQAQKLDGLRPVFSSDLPEGTQP